jgi:DNA-binding NarL/FixJ family response regulator
MIAQRHTRPAKKAPARVVLVDDHPLVRERLAEIIEAQPDLEVCGQAEDRHRAMEIVKAEKPDLVIVDLSLKNSHGLDLIKDLQALNPALAILVVSMHDEAVHAERVIRAGASGYITKQEATKRIMVAVRTVLRGDVYLSEKTAMRLAGKIARKQAAAAIPILETLSDRELCVLQLIGEGNGTRQIAGILKLSVPTIETYKARLKEKLQLRDGNQLLQFGIRFANSES